MSTALGRLAPDRRRALVRQAAQEFATAGFAGASLNRIIAAMGMSKSSFYHLLASKRELFELVVADLTAQVGTELRVPAPAEFGGPQFWDTVEGFLAELTQVLAGSEEALLLGRMVYAGAGAGAGAGDRTGAGDGDTAGAEVIAPIEAWVGRVLAAGRESGQVRDGLPADLQLALVVAVLRTMDEWAVRHAATLDSEQARELNRAQFAMLRRMLEPHA